MFQKATIAVKKGISVLSKKSYLWLMFEQNNIKDL